MKKIILLAAIAIATVSLSLAITDGKKSKKQSGSVEGLNIGNKAPDLKFKNPEGKEIALSSLRGKIVLVDFWASWCRPCRMENPNVVAAYNKYKSAKFKSAKGFDIYSVSLDENPEAWKNAIQKDQLIWQSHVSDLKGWGSAGAAIYKVTGIPTNWLLDENGVIIGQSLRGEKLDAALESLLKK